MSIETLYLILRAIGMVAGTGVIAWFLNTKHGEVLIKYPLGQLVLVSVGVSVVLIAHTWGDWTRLGIWFAWFFFGSLPIIAHVIRVTIKEFERREFEKHRIESNR